MSGINEPVIGADGTIYISDQYGSVYAIDKHGRELWRSNVGRSARRPCLAGPNRVIVAEIAGAAFRTFCLDSSTGTVIWQFDKKGHRFDIAATADVVVHVTTDGGTTFDDEPINHLVALAVQTGEELWATRSEAYLFASMIIDDLVVVGARGSLRAFELKTGKLVAQFAIQQDAANDKGLLPLSDGFVFSDDRGTVRRASLANKRSLFRSSMQFNECWSNSLPAKLLGRPAGFDSTVAVLDESGSIHLLSSEDGRTLSSFDMKTGSSESNGGVAEAGQFLAAAHGKVLALYRFTNAQWG